MSTTIHPTKFRAAAVIPFLTLVPLLLLALVPGGCHHSGSGSVGGTVVVPGCETPPEALAFLDGAPIYTPFVEIPANTLLGTGECPIVGEIIDPPLPSGLTFEIDENGAAIVGIPVQPDTTSSHSITVLFETGEVSVDITITVLPLLPFFSYPTADVTVASGEEITPIVPEMAPSSGVADSWSAAPSLPAGLQLAGDSGIISGTPEGSAGPIAIVVTATNSAGDHSESITFTILGEPMAMERAVVRESSNSTELQRLYLGYDQNIAPASGGPPPTVEVTGSDDSLGDSAVATVEAERFLSVELGTGASIKSRQNYDPSLGDGPNSPSGLQVLGGIFSQMTGLEVALDAPVDIVPGLVPRLGITSSTPGPTTAAHLFHLDSGPYPTAVTIGDGSVHLSRIVSDAAGLDIEPWTVLSGEEVVAVVSCDYDNDGDGDLITTGDTHTVVWLQEGGNFNSSVLSSDGGDAIVTGDIDADGDLDVICADHDDDLLIFIGDGNGGFEDGEIELEIGGALLLEDLDDDGDLDLFIGNEGSGTPHLLMGVDGQLLPLAVSPIPGPGALGAVSGDFDRDGKTDIALCRENGDVEIFFGEGDLNFTTTSAAIATSGTALETLDIDSDGALDLLLPGGGAILGCFNDGSGNFSPPTQLTDWQISLTGALGIGDFDLDGDVDAIAGYSGDATQTLLLASALSSSWGSATFGSSVEIADIGESHALASADIDSDGIVDVVIAGTAEAGGAGTSRILFGRNDGTFDVIDLGVPADTRAVALIDADSDGDLDIVLGCYEDASRLLTNLGDRTFTPSLGLPTFATDATTSLAVADIDHDGASDIIEGVHGTNRIWRGDGNGGFSATNQPFPHVHTYSIAVLDTEGDGDLDLVFGNSTGRHNRIWINDGNGLFSVDGQILGLMEVRSIATADIDRDGDIDLFLGQNGAGPVGFSDALWLNDGDGVFTSVESPSPDPHTTFSCALEDIDGDGKVDLILGQEDGIRLLRQGPEGFTTTELLSGGLTTSILPVDFDGDGDVDIFGGRTAGLDDRILINQ